MSRSVYRSPEVMGRDSVLCSSSRRICLASAAAIFSWVRTWGCAIAPSGSSVELTDGAFSPSSEVIGFAGPGRGLKALREYGDNPERAKGPLWEDKLREAQRVSPLHHVTPSAPPIALFGGYGDDGVNIAFRQCLHTFSALERAGCRAFLFGNTHGKYGENEETIAAIHAFFDRHL